MVNRPVFIIYDDENAPLAYRDLPTARFYAMRVLAEHHRAPSVYRRPVAIVRFKAWKTS